jgi:predicted membrane-bound dolichyl-phosphate-mannose-protein mannosyltransferase
MRRPTDDFPHPIRPTMMIDREPSAWRIPFIVAASLLCIVVTAVSLHLIRDRHEPSPQASIVVPAKVCRLKGTVYLLSSFKGCRAAFT